MAETAYERIRDRVAMADLRLVVELAWRMGVNYQPDGPAAMADDIRHAATLRPPSVPYEDRVAARVVEMEAYAARVVEENLAYVRRNREHDQAVIAAGKRASSMCEHQHPSTGKCSPECWRAVHATVSTTVWERIWADLSPRTRAGISDLAPPGWRRGLAVVS